MKTERIKNAFSLPELLTAIAIITILVAILIPALNQARNFAKDTKQKVQLQAIDVAINYYKGDFGDYPPSHGDPYEATPDYSYCGAQTLAEAIVGYDLLGVHPDTIYDCDGVNTDGEDLYNIKKTDTDFEKNITSRRGPYVEFKEKCTFTLDELCQQGTYTSSAKEDVYMICDLYDNIKAKVTTYPSTGPSVNKTIKAGTPILYFRANNNKYEHDYSSPEDSIYNFYDNFMLIDTQKSGEDKGTPLVGGSVLHKFYEKSGRSPEFYTFIKDPIKTTSNNEWPVNRDTFILISAGSDGIYGTRDDICNFEPNFEP